MMNRYQNSFLSVMNRRKFPAYSVPMKEITLKDSPSSDHTAATADETSAGSESLAKSPDNKNQWIPLQGGDAKSLDIPSTEGADASKDSTDHDISPLTFYGETDKADDEISDVENPRDANKNILEAVSSSIGLREDVHSLGGHFSQLESRFVDLEGKKEDQVEQLREKLDQARQRALALEKELFLATNKNVRTLSDLNQKTLSLEQEVSAKKGIIEKLEGDMRRVLDEQERTYKKLAETRARLEEADRLLMLSLLSDDDRRSLGKSTSASSMVVHEMKTSLAEEESRIRSLRARLSARKLSSLSVPTAQISSDGSEDDLDALSNETNNSKFISDASDVLEEASCDAEDGLLGLSFDMEELSIDEPLAAIPLDDLDFDGADDMPYAALDYDEGHPCFQAEAWRATNHSLRGLVAGGLQVA